MTNKKYVIGIILMLFMLCATASAIDAASAAKYKVDKGSVITSDGKGMMKWDTTLDTKNNARTISATIGNYNKKTKKYNPREGSIITLKKVSKTKIKIVSVEPKSGQKVTSYKKTKLSTRLYYWNVYRPYLIKNFKKTETLL